MAVMQNKLMVQEMNGQRPQTPGDNAPSPSKRPRLENGASFDTRQVSGGGPQQIIQNGQAFGPSHPMKLEQPNGMQGAIPAAGHGEGNFDSPNPTTNLLTLSLDEPRHALQDYQMQLMLLEEQNKKRLMQAGNPGARDNGPVPGAGPGPYAPNMSPSGSRGAVPSPGPADQIKRIAGTPKMPQQNMGGSPMPDMQNRVSPAPNFDPNAGQMAAGMPSQYYANMANNPMQRPPSSHPGAFGMATSSMAMNPQALEHMQRVAQNTGRLPNGSPWPPNGSPAMQPGQNPALRLGQGPGTMGPPPTPAGEQQQLPPQRTQPSSPAQPPAPPTPQQSKANAPKNSKKDSAANKKVSLTCSRKKINNS
jgi:hypothetical protein